MKARRFTETGVAAFRDWVIAAREARASKREVAAVPLELLAEATETAYDLPEENPNFPDKFAIGEFFCEVFPAGSHEVVRLDAGMWSWLAAKYFDQITSDRSKIKEPRAYVADIGYQEYYRHLLLAPYLIYFSSLAEPQASRVLLYDVPWTMNEVMVQFGSYQTLFKNKDIRKLIDRLYFDTAKRRIKRGAGGKASGTPRRLMSFVRQIELNYDLDSISVDRMWQMLPAEFNKFKGPAQGNLV